MGTNILDDAHSRTRTLISDMWEEMEQSRMEREAEAARSDPQKNAKTTVFPDGANWKYYRPKVKGEPFGCYSVRRNAAGFFLSWLQVETETHIKREKFAAHKKKKAAMASAARHSGRTKEDGIG